MLDQSEVMNFLSALEIPVHGALVQDAAQDGRLYVFVTVTRNSENRQVPSNAALQGAKEQLGLLGAKVDFVLIDGQQRDIETGLRATLLHSFPNEIRNSFLSLVKNNATVWLDAKRELETGTLTEIKEKIKVFLDQFEMVLESLDTTSGQNLPSKTVILRAIRQLSPVSVESLAGHLTGRDFSVPSRDWMVRRLDAIRKSGLIVRLHSGLYTLSLNGLRLLGTAKNRSSPDISRLLALAFGRN